MKQLLHPNSPEHQELVLLELGVTSVEALMTVRPRVKCIGDVRYLLSVIARASFVEFVCRARLLQFPQFVEELQQLLTLLLAVEKGFGFCVSPLMIDDVGSTYKSLSFPLYCLPGRPV